VRLFVAVDVPDALRDAIESEVVELLRPQLPEARWTRPEGRHLTLKFLGEVPEERTADVAEALREAACGHPPFRTAFATLGGFPSMRRPRVLWVGIGEGADAMAGVAADVDAALEPLGFAREKRPFAAHLTLARFKVPKPVGDLPAVLVPAKGFTAAEVVLVRSQLHPKGARYTEVARFPLRGSATSTPG